MTYCEIGIEWDEQPSCGGRKGAESARSMTGGDDLGFVIADAVHRCGYGIPMENLADAVEWLDDFAGCDEPIGPQQQAFDAFVQAAHDYILVKQAARNAYQKNASERIDSLLK